MSLISLVLLHLVCLCICHQVHQSDGTLNDSREMTPDLLMQAMLYEGEVPSVCLITFNDIFYCHVIKSNICAVCKTHDGMYWDVL